MFYFIIDLGASPNYRDARGLTPLYHSVTHSTDPMVCEALLYDYAVIGATDNQGWQETHQVSRRCLRNVDLFILFLSVY